MRFALDWTSLYVLMLLAGCVYYFAVVLRRRGQPCEPQCGGCGYLVAGLTGLRCPECGQDVRTVGIVVHRRARRLFPIEFGFLWIMLTAFPAFEFGVWLSRSVIPSRLVVTHALSLRQPTLTRLGSLDLRMSGTSWGAPYTRRMPALTECSLEYVLDGQRRAVAFRVDARDEPATVRDRLALAAEDIAGAGGGDYLTELAAVIHAGIAGTGLNGNRQLNSGTTTTRSTNSVPDEALVGLVPDAAVAATILAGLVLVWRARSPRPPSPAAAGRVPAGQSGGPAGADARGGPGASGG